MLYQVVVTVALVSHFVFLAYVVAGGFLAWRWPWAIWPHLIAAAWGFLAVSTRLDCPLTFAETWGRRRASEQGLSPGFLDTYMEDIIYPGRYLLLLQVLIGVVVVTSWAGYVILRVRRVRG